MDSIRPVQTYKPAFGGSKKTPPKKEHRQDNKENNKSSLIMSGLTAAAAVGAAIVIINNQKPKAAEIVKQELNTFADFLQKARESGLNKSEDYLKNCIDANILGTGANSKVYKFTNPLMKNWAIKIDTKHGDFMESFSKPLQQVEDEFSGLNMGQEIAKIGDRVHILKRINGKPHSIPDWSTHRRSKVPIKQEEAGDFLSDVKKIAGFPQEAFNEYAKKLKVLDEKGYKADSFNPNNYLIDFEKQHFYIIDAYKYDVDAHLNTKYDLFCPLVDYPNFERFYQVMDDAGKAEFLSTTKTLFDKCTIAGENQGLNTSENVFREFIARIDSREGNGGMYTNSYNAMKKICGAVL